MKGDSLYTFVLGDYFSIIPKFHYLSRTSYIDFIIILLKESHSDKN